MKERLYWDNIKNDNNISGRIVNNSRILFFYLRTKTWQRNLIRRVSAIVEEHSCLQLIFCWLSRECVWKQSGSKFRVERSKGSSFIIVRSVFIITSVTTLPVECPSRGISSRTQTLNGFTVEENPSIVDDREGKKNYQDRTRCRHINHDNEKYRGAHAQV